MPEQRTHLDLGCGLKPKNPYGYETLFGIDIRAREADPSGATVIGANLATQPIPFADDSFDSVSAYDFFEHIPRVALDYASNTSRFPFVELMSEIWRVLKPDGLLYAITPAFPSEKALRDPTHVNIITRKTHRYFTQPDVLGRMYGFKGQFQLVRQAWVHPRDAYEPMNPGIGRRLRNLTERLSGEQSHLIWELKAVKDTPRQAAAAAAVAHS
ncbi:methyltransferase domain-containing protein [Lacisediminimonas profundi]|uniref:methyltransferase domain-containing protein n=1 Tax=Lacisediminimonas profundi TaxID=2603856 RepID=UPI00124BB80B|nr:class I SAM-dependent methyltransferase [Lacisediminimonas profundi]